jgi:6-pyruvoyltetrahydropterin/6-carboxytetrahydropterin synthase
VLELRIDGWRKGLRFSSAHITPEHKKCGRLHGHTYAMHLRMLGSQDEWGIVLDFGIITDTLKQIGDEIDHLVLVPTESNHYSDLKVTKDTVQFRVTDPYTGEPKRFNFPRQDCALLPIPSTTAEDLAKYVYREFMRRTKFTTDTAFVEIGIDEGYGKGAWYGESKPGAKPPMELGLANTVGRQGYGEGTGIRLTSGGADDADDAPPPRAAKARKGKRGTA